MPFQLHFGKSARILPPLISLEDDEDRDVTAREIIELMQPIQMEANDSLLTTKIRQAQQENQHRGKPFPFKIGEHVVLSTSHRRRAYKLGEEPRAAKFMLRLMAHM